MKKTIFITIGVLIFILIIGVWAYLFTYGVPASSSDIFAHFGGATTPNTNPSVLIDTTLVDTQNTTSEGIPQALKQLTTRPVAGAGFIDRSILYVEQGTGHVYSIDLTTGSETLLSGTTIPGAREAFFSHDGSYVAMTMVENTISKTLVGKIGINVQFSGVALPSGATQIHFGSTTGTIQYIIVSAVGTIGYTYDIVKDSTTQIFTLPLRDIRVLWGDPLYVYTTPSSQEIGYVYRVVKNDVHFITSGKFGLMAFTTPTGLMVTANIDSVVTTIHTGGIRDIRQALPLIPEKCASGLVSTYCAVPRDSELDTLSFPDAWYKGIVSYTDVLWNIDPTTGRAISLVDFLDISKRAIDVSTIGINSAGNMLFFINKNDNTLWVFDTTL